MDLKKGIEDFDLAFLDLETTGLDAVTGDSICEVGAVKVRERRIIDKFHSLINPQRDVPYEAYLIHKISNEELQSAPSFNEVVNSLLYFLDNCVICAYNVEFDMSFLNQELRRINYPLIQLPAIDIFAMARKTIKLPRYNLGAIASFFNVKSKESHRALGDAFAAWGVFFKLRDILKEKEVDRLGDFISLYGLDNDIFKAQENAKALLLKEAIAKGTKLRVRYFSYANRIEEESIKPITLRQESKNFYIYYQNIKTGAYRIALNHILDINEAWYNSSNIKFTKGENLIK